LFTRGHLVFGGVDPAAPVLAVTPRIDRSYVERCASAFGVLDLWREISGGTAG
jgi:hypothetical protein